MENEYLAHHGIKGQKWGVRRFQNEDGSLTSAGKQRYLTSENSKRGDKFSNKVTQNIEKMENAKTRIGKSFYNSRAFNNQFKANRAYDVANNTKFTKKVGAVIGSGAAASLNDASEDYFTRQAEYRKTKIGKHISSVNAYNAHEGGSALERVHNSKNAKEYVENLLDSSFNTNIKSISGRVRTNGERVALTTLGNAFGLSNLDSALDIVYGIDKFAGGKIDKKVDDMRSSVRNKVQKAIT